MKPKPLPQEIWYVIASFCNIKALYTLINTSILKSVNYKKLSDTCHERLQLAKRVYESRKKSPIICACEKKRFEDVLLLLLLLIIAPNVLLYVQKVEKQINMMKMVDM